MKRTTPRTRLDNLLVTRGLAQNAQKAQAMILAGEENFDGLLARLAEQLELRNQPMPEVRRGRLPGEIV